MRPPRVLAGIITFNPQGYPHLTEMWIDAIECLLMQNTPSVEIDVLVIDNTSHPVAIETVKKKFKYDHRVRVISIRRPRHSSHVCWNKGLMLCSNKEDYDYIYMSASDCMFRDENGMERLVKEMREIPDVGILSPQISFDLTVQGWLDKYTCNDWEASAKAVDLGEQIYLHCYLFSKEFLKAYDYKRPDILWGHMTETWYPFMCHAIGKKFYVSSRAIVEHLSGKERSPETKTIYTRPTIGTWEEFFKKFESADQMVAFEPRRYKKEMIKVMAPVDDPSVGIRAFNTNHSPRSFEYRKDKIQDRERMYRWIKENLFIPNSYYDRKIFYRRAREPKL